MELTIERCRRPPVCQLAEAPSTPVKAPNMGLVISEEGSGAGGSGVHIHHPVCRVGQVVQVHILVQGGLEAFALEDVGQYGCPQSCRAADLRQQDGHLQHSHPGSELTKPRAKGC